MARGTNGTYFGHDGNAYRKDSTGNWSQYNNENWNHVDTSNAQAQAQQIASAAGSAIGRITGISGSTSNGTGNCSATVTFGLGYTGNPGPHAISITASRTSPALPDQVLISISVTSGIAAGLDDITSALTQAGVAGANFSNVYSLHI